MLKTKCHSAPIGIGIFEPENTISSIELLEQIDPDKFGIQKNWIDRVLGITERRYSDPDSKPSDLAFIAAEEALKKAQILPHEIDYILFVSIDRDYNEPGTSHIIQNRLKADNAICLDMTNACHGFMNGIHFIDTLIGSGQIKYGLIVSGEQPSKVSQRVIKKLAEHHSRDKFKQYIGALSVGDAGAAMVLGPKGAKELGFQAMHFHSRGEFAEMCSYSETNDPSLEYGRMDMTGIVNAIINLHSEIFAESMQYFNWCSNDIDHFVTHQVGKKMFAMHSEYSDVPISKMSNTVTKYGNLTSTTIPFNLHKMYEADKLNSGDKVFIAAAGSGLSLSNTALIWD